MAFSTQQNFVGELDGTNIVELNKKVDFNKTKLEDRKKVVEDILDNTEFYHEYFDNYFKASINTTDFLSHETNICKSLDRMATYLLNSEEVKAEEDSEKTQYVFHADPKYFQKKVDRENSISAVSAENEEHEENIIHFLKGEEPNHKKDKTQKITSADLEREDEVGRILSEYHSFSEYVSNELKNPDTKFNRFLLTKIKGQLENDMIYTKDHLLGVWGYKLKAFSESTEYDVDVFDFTNELHLKGDVIKTESGKGIIAKGLMFFKPEFDPNNDFSFILMDLENTIAKAELTEEEQYILNETRNGSTQEEIADDLGTYQMKISRALDKIARKIAAVGDKYDGQAVEA
ncbi:hypothetical protein ABFY54_28905 [Priestia megaterium]|uniref:hypothetical protein n=1 Tax=Priestia megaterium TaxID=1404 RepID=UPI003D2AAC23